VIRWLIDAVCDLFDPPFRVRYFEDDPERSQLSKKTFGIVGSPSHNKYAHFVCPCGCGEVIVLTSNSKVRPRWIFSVDSLLRPTVRPSVWRTRGCRSHFILARGHVHWVPEATSIWDNEELP
jgi:hypothetical protein